MTDSRLERRDQRHLAHGQEAEEVGPGGGRRRGQEDEGGGQQRIRRHCRGQVVGVKIERKGCDIHSSQILNIEDKFLKYSTTVSN